MNRSKAHKPHHKKRHWRRPKPTYTVFILFYLVCICRHSSYSGTTLVQSDTIDRLTLYFTSYGVAKYYGKMKVDNLKTSFTNDVSHIMSCDTFTFDSLVNSLFRNTPKKAENTSDSIPLCASIDYSVFGSGLLRERTRNTILSTLHATANRNYRKSIRWPLPKKWRHELPELNYEDCLLGICDYWNILRFYYPYRDKLDLSNNAPFEGILMRFLHSKKPLKQAYYWSLVEISNLFSDCHTSLSLSNFTYIEDQLLGNRYPYMGTDMYDDVMIITSIWEELSRASNMVYGDTILKIDGIPTTEHIKRYNAFLTCEQPDDRQSYYAQYYALCGWQNESKELEIKRGDSSFTYTVQCTTRLNASVWYDPVETLPGFVRINDSTVYAKVDLSRKEFRLLRKSGFTHLILDCRVYPNQRSWKIVNRLDPTETHMYRYGIVKTPCKVRYLKIRYHYMYLPMFVRSFNTRTYVLQNGKAASFGESVLMALKFGDIPNITSYGSPSSGTFGAVGYFQLSGGVILRTTVDRQIGLDGTVYQFEGLQPDVHVRLNDLTPSEIWLKLQSLE